MIHAYCGVLPTIDPTIDPTVCVAAGSMVKMRDVIKLLEEQDLVGRIKTIVGGAPVSEAYAREIGADAHGFDAASAVERVKALVGEN